MCIRDSFRNRPAILEAYDEELFLLLVDHITVLPGRRLVFWLKNGLELEENGQEAVSYTHLDVYKRQGCISVPLVSAIKVSKIIESSVSYAHTKQ